MAQKVIVETVDDLDGSVGEDIMTVKFSLDGRAYEIDLNGGNAQKLRDKLAEFIAAGRLAHPHRSGTKTGTSVSARNTMSRERAHAIREWAQEAGYVIAGRGRISAAVICAYEQAQRELTTSGSQDEQAAKTSEEPKIVVEIRNPAFSG